MPRNRARFKVRNSDDPDFAALVTEAGDDSSDGKTLYEVDFLGCASAADLVALAHAVLLREFPKIPAHVVVDLMRAGRIEEGVADAD